VIEALREGRAYAVSRTNEIASARETIIDDVEFSNATLKVSCIGEPSTFLFVGQNGIVRKTVKNSMTAAYTFSHDDTYIRTVIRSPRTSMFLNPIVRNTVAGLPSPEATINVAATWLMRGGMLVTAVAVVLMLRDRRRLSRAPSRRPVLTPADRETA